MTLRFALKTTVAIMVSMALCPVAEAQQHDAIKRRKPPAQEYVFVTGSLLPQRVTNGRVVSVQGSSLVIVNRRRIDQTGRVTTADILRTEPSLFVYGY